MENNQSKHEQFENRIDELENSIKKLEENIKKEDRAFLKRARRSIAMALLLFIIGYYLVSYDASGIIDSDKSHVVQLSENQYRVYAFTSVSFSETKSDNVKSKYLFEKFFGFLDIYDLYIVDKDQNVDFAVSSDDFIEEPVEKELKLRTILKDQNHDLYVIFDSGDTLIDTDHASYKFGFKLRLPIDTGIFFIPFYSLTIFGFSEIVSRVIRVIKGNSN